MLDDYLRLRNAGCRWQTSQSIPHRVRELGASSDETSRISKVAEANQRQHCNLATSVAFDTEEAMVEERARGRPK